MLSIGMIQAKIGLQFDQDGFSDCDSVEAKTENKNRVCYLVNFSVDYFSLYKFKKIDRELLHDNARILSFTIAPLDNEKVRVSFMVEQNSEN